MSAVMRVTANTHYGTSEAKYNGVTIKIYWALYYFDAYEIDEAQRKANNEAQRMVLSHGIVTQTIYATIYNKAALDHQLHLASVSTGKSSMCQFIF